MKNNTQDTGKPSLFTRLYDRAMALYQYCTVGVWESTKHSFAVTTLKTINLSVRSFMDRNLQIKSTSLTYNTILALVPALALLFAICRGFGFQNLLQDTLMQYLPGQEETVNTVLHFVDSYLKESSQGLFVGVGIVMLLWTLISLLSNIEAAFNSIWDIKRERTFYQKVTAYISLCLMVPVLIICSSGVSIFMSTTLEEKLHLPFLTPLINLVLEFSPFVLVWLAFSLSYLLIPNTRVEFRYAAIAGAICAVMFQILQLLFVNGQIYVSKYNAIYGSFAFLPLLLVWLQFSWLILLFGCVLTYSLQNVFAFNYLGELSEVSTSYMRKVILVVAAVTVNRFAKGQPPLTRNQISTTYGLPMRLVGYVCWRLKHAGLLNYVVMHDDTLGMAPAVDTANLTVGELWRRLDNEGNTNFIPKFNTIYADLIAEADSLETQSLQNADKITLTSLPLPEPEKIAHTLAEASPVVPINGKRKKQSDTQKPPKDTGQ